MRDAVAVSDNVVAVKWNELVGPRHVIQTARRMGITSPLQPTLPLVLGAYGVTPLQMASAYVPLANLGTAYAPWSVRKVVDAEGVTVWQPPTPHPKPALDPGVAYIVTSLFQSVLTSGTGKKLLPLVGRTAAGKTGTTSSLKDAWFVGYTPQLVTAVWVGDDTPANLGGYGSGLAGPIWAHFMALALEGTPDTTWTMPADVTVCRVSAIDGLLPNPSSPTVEEVFLKKTVPTRVSPTIGTGGITPGITGLPGSSVQPPTGLTSDTASTSGSAASLSHASASSS
jgi:membrane carboxypeptidase/penicillin-binding protein